jgi:hypothetical protein
VTAPTEVIAAVMPGMFRELVHVVAAGARTMWVTPEYPMVFFALCGCPCHHVDGEHPWMQWPQCADCEAIWNRIAAAVALTPASGGNDAH